jgi:hypothetical protein
MFFWTNDVGGRDGSVHDQLEDHVILMQCK